MASGRAENLVDGAILSYYTQTELEHSADSETFLFSLTPNQR
jgi:hypothetical protein